MRLKDYPGFYFTLSSDDVVVSRVYIRMYSDTQPDHLIAEYGQSVEKNFVFDVLKREILATATEMARNHLRNQNCHSWLKAIEQIGEPEK